MFTFFLKMLFICTHAQLKQVIQRSNCSGIQYFILLWSLLKILFVFHVFRRPWCFVTTSYSSTSSCAWMSRHVGYLFANVSLFSLMNTIFLLSNKSFHFRFTGCYYYPLRVFNVCKLLWVLVYTLGQFSYYHFVYLSSLFETY